MSENFACKDLGQKYYGESMNKMTKSCIYTKVTRMVHELKQELSSANAMATRASRESMLGLFGYHNHFASSGFSLHISQNKWNVIGDTLKDILGEDIELKQLYIHIAQELKNAYNNTNSNPYPNRLSSTISDIESKIRRFENLLLKYNDDKKRNYCI